MRIRTVKPEFWQSESIGRLSVPARLLLIGLFSSADDSGRFRASPQLLACSIFAYDSMDPSELSGYLSELSGENIIDLYMAGGSSYGVVCNFAAHQKIDKRSKPKYPAPPDTREESAEPPESSKKIAQEQGTGNREQGTGIREQGVDERCSPAHEDIFSDGPLPETQSTPQDEWRYKIQTEPWSRAIKSAGGKIGPKNWEQWQALHEQHGAGLITAVKNVAPDDRWPDKVEMEMLRPKIESDDEYDDGNFNGEVIIL